MVRCKFYLDKKIEKSAGPGMRVYELEFNPVTHGSPENESFFQWTPYGQLKFGTINEEAAKKFETGKEYYIDISEV